MFKIQSQSPAAQLDLFLIISGVKFGSLICYLIALKLLSGTNSWSIFSLNPSNVNKNYYGFAYTDRAVFQLFSVFSFLFLSIGTFGSIEQSKCNTQVNTFSISFGGDFKDLSI